MYFKFNLIQAFMVVLVTCINEENPIKMKAIQWSQHYQSSFTCKMLKGS